MTRVILASLPLSGTKDATWASLQQLVSEVSFDTPTYRFEIPELRIETLNSLLTIGDDLNKISSFVETVMLKVRGKIEELEKITSDVATSLLMDGIPIEVFVTRFRWNMAKYPVETFQKNTTTTIQRAASQFQEDLKVRVGEYSSIKTKLETTLRMQLGSLPMRDLSTFAKHEDIVNTEHLTTLGVIVPRPSKQEWLLNYENFSTFVVPNSAKKLYEDADYSLYSVIVFRHVVAAFTMAARNKYFQVKSLTPDPSPESNIQAELEHLQLEYTKRRHSLLHWCYATFGEVVDAWMHLCALQIFTESILRYGLPPSFLAIVLVPKQENEEKIRRLLNLFSGGNMSGNGKFWTTEEDPSMIALVGGGSEGYPYVSITINLPS